MFTTAKLAPEFQNYCLKGSQIDFITSTGLPTLLGNSVTEDHFSNTSSCMACHSRAAFDAKGHQFFPMAGFIDPPVPSECPVPNRSITACSPNGAPQPSWFWSNPGTPQQKKKYMQADFVWSVPFLALPK